MFYKAIFLEHSTRVLNVGPSQGGLTLSTLFYKKQMASPQTENGYVRIANEIMDQLSVLMLTGREWNIVMFVLRKTWGWGKPDDLISLTQFQRGCKMRRGQVCGLLKSLVHKKILLKKGSVYKFNKNYEQWVVPASGPVSSSGLVPRGIIRVVPSSGQTKESNTNTIVTKERAAEAASPSTIFQEFITNPKPIIEKLVRDYDIEEDVATKQVYAFIEYWTEPTKSGKLQRWQTEKTFELNRRLKKWFNNYYQWQK